MSSSYDSAMVDSALIEDPRLLTLPRGVRLLHLEALVYSKGHRLDGFVPAGALRRLTDEPDERYGVEQLVDAGLWELDDRGGWQLVDYSDSQWTAKQVQGRIDSQRKARDRYEKKHPDRPRKKSRDTSRDRSRDRSNRPTDRPTDRSEEVGSRADSGARLAPVVPISTGTIDGRPVDDVAADLARDNPDRYAGSTIEGHLGTGR